MSSDESSGSSGSFWQSFGPIMMALAGAVLMLLVVANTVTNSEQDERIEKLKESHTSIRERLGKIETHIEHIKKSQDDVGTDVSEIRRLLEGRPVVK